MCVVLVFLRDSLIVCCIKCKETVSVCRINVKRLHKCMCMQPVADTLFYPLTSKSRFVTLTLNFVCRGKFYVYLNMVDCKPTCILYDFYMQSIIFSKQSITLEFKGQVCSKWYSWQCGSHEPHKILYKSWFTVEVLCWL